ncbi:fasciclin domain-containing protein [Chitinophaga sp. 22620]|uniref:fasciclin domain-containing protein n=1 Tax=Chitinophaga sp. 22620 TaxID=3453952 RepID=UPI003F8547BE
MRKNYNYLYKLLLFIIPFTVSCQHDQLEVYEENINYRPAGDFIRNNYDLSMFAAALEKTGLMQELNGPGPFTVLAPANSAFYELGLQRPSDLDRLNTDSLRIMMRYHVLSRKLTTAEIPAKVVDARYKTLADGKELFVSNRTTNGNVSLSYFNGATASPVDVVVTNGTIHVLNKVMKYNEGTVRDWLAHRPEYSVLSAGFEKFGLWDMLAEKGPFTVFAPDNAAFEAAGIDADSIARMDTSMFYGHRLFGAYIQRNRNFFISDFIVFRANSNQYFLETAIYGDPYILVVSPEEQYGTAALKYTFWLRSAKDFPYISLQQVQGAPSAMQDNLTDNGIIQPLTALGVTPADALK